MVTTLLKTTTIITEVEGVEESILPAEVAAMTAVVEEDTTEVVVDGTEGEGIPDMTEISRIIKTWTMTIMVAVPREAEMTSKMKVAETGKNTGIEMGEATTETMEGEVEGRMAEEVDTKEDGATTRAVRAAEKQKVMTREEARVDITPRARAKV